MTFHQKNPKRKETYYIGKGKKNRSKTNSLESYNNAAKQEVCLLMKNNRRPKHSIVLHLLMNLGVNGIRKRWKKIKAYLRKVGIIAYCVIEITRDKNGNPTDRVHYHILVDSPLSEKELRSLFRDCCLCSGLEENDFRIDYKAVHKFLGLVCYITKLNRPEKVILFVKNTGIRKFETIGNWYLDESGNPITRKAAWEKIREEQSKLKAGQDTQPDGTTSDHEQMN